VSAGNLVVRETLASGRAPQWRRLVAVVLPVVALGALAAVVAGRREVFADAFGSAPLWLLAVAVLLQLVALLSRTEAWHRCVGAAGATVPRRGVFRASGVGGLGSIVNGQLGVATRIATLRRSAPSQCPRVGALLAAEVPILAVEASLAALTSFTLLGPLGLPWWSALLCIGVSIVVIWGLSILARRKTTGLWSGLAILRSLDGRSQIVGLVLIAVVAQIARNWLALNAIGVDASPFDAVAVLIALVTLSQLPLGPSVGAAAVVLILGSNGVALTTAAGILLSATGLVGTLCFGGWAVADRLRPAVTQRRPSSASRRPGR
jgi:hypothetical protein